MTYHRAGLPFDVHGKLETLHNNCHILFLVGALSLLIDRDHVKKKKLIVIVLETIME